MKVHRGCEKNNKSSKPPFLGVSRFIFRGDGKNLENNFPFHQPAFHQPEKTAEVFTAWLAAFP